jgi:aldehyde dehydrogenase (NAD+)
MAQFTFGKSRMPNGDVIPSEIADKDSYVIRKPKGVIGVISPWNFPYAIGGFWCAAPALLEGNTVIWKPSENTPMVAQMAVAQYIEAGFPNGVINLLHGSGHVGSELVYNKDIKHYCFTGSYKTGQFIRQICAVQGNKTCSLEMGSKSAVIVCADADMDMAVKACVASAYKLSGQRCVSAGRILVEQQVFMEFARRFVEESQKVELGPLINAEQKKKVSEYNALTYQDEYTQVLLSAKTTDSGNFISPHIYTTKWNVPESRKFLIEEVFGPHVALIPFDDLDEAIAIYNDTNFGLSLGVITEDFRKAKKVQQECEFGLGYWNGGTIAAESHLPFGGIKNSGYGGSSAAGTFESVVNKVTWTVNYQKEIVFPQGMK